MIHPLNTRPEREIFCNRTLNLRSIQAIGYDMDYTLVHYNVREWEGTAYQYIKDRLATMGFPVADLDFQPALVNRGLVIDRQQGHIVKANRFGYVKAAMHGTRMLDFRETRRAYARVLIDLNDPRFVFLNTLFSISEACMFAQLVDLSDAGKLAAKYHYTELHDAVRFALDAAHVEGAMKRNIMDAPDRYVESEPETAEALLDQKHAGKRLLLITNSEWEYTSFMMRHAFDPHLPDGMGWRDLFDLVVVSARKPAFFTQSDPIFEVVNDEGLLRPVVGLPRRGGAYLGGHATLIEDALKLDGEKILYVGDHIYGDVNVSKQICRWRTALILRELEREVTAIGKDAANRQTITDLMEKKTLMEHDMSALRLRVQRARRGYLTNGDDPDALEAELLALREQVVKIDDQIGPLVGEDGRAFSKLWGYLLRAGNDKSHLTRQIERYADIYTSRVSNFLPYTPFTYFRSPRGSLPHDPGV